MGQAEIQSLPVNPGGPCRRPTARRVLDLFDNMQRHTLSLAGQPPTELLTEFSPLQRKLLRLRPEDYRHRQCAGQPIR